MNEKPRCPKCHQTCNVIQLVVGFRCAYCQIIFFTKTGGQSHLNF